MKQFKRSLTAALCFLISVPWNSVIAASADRVLDQGTRVYLVLDKEVTSERGEFDVGNVIPCRVWRDVEQGGILFIKGGTPAACQVEKIKRRQMGGGEGKISVTGLETQSADGQKVMLSGGYNKDGGGRKAVVWTVGLLLLWPVLFVPGKQAILPPGTVFDVTTVNALHYRVEGPGPASVPKLNLAGMGSGLTAEVMLDDLLQQKKPDTMRIKLQKDGGIPGQLVVDSVNGKLVDAISLKLSDQKEVDGTPEAIGEIKLKPLAAHFQKGINRFDVAYREAGERKSVEVILDVQM